MNLLITFARAYPWQSLLMVGALLLAGIAEGVSLTALLPLMGLAIESGGGAGPAADAQDGLARTVKDTLEMLGLSPTLVTLLVVVVIGMTLKSILVLVAQRQVGYTKARVATDLRLSLLRAILSTRWDYFLHQPVGRLTNSMATEAWRASDAYEFGATMTAFAVQAVVYTVVALLVSWKATLASVGAAALVLFVSHFLVRMTRKAGKRQTHLLKSLLARMTDTLQSVKTLKAMGREDLADGVLRVETSKLNRALEKEVFSKAVLSSAQEPMFTIVVAVGIYVLLERWGMPIASVMVLVLVLTRVLAHLGKIQKHYQKMMAAESAYWSLLEAVKDAENRREEVEGIAPPGIEVDLRLEDVSFDYGEKGVLDHVTIEMPAGSLTTIIGPSGAGKTTILDLITGLQMPTEGRVLADGVALGSVDLRAWRRQIGYVPQETVLLHDSVLNNVTLGDPALTQADAEYALRAAGAWDFIQATADGLEGTVGERGARLSSGQRQRIMLARALAHRPRLLILDEATSALDKENEAAICETLKGLKGDLTIVAISHQPAIAEAADRVYHLEDGRITSQETIQPADTGTD